MKQYISKFLKSVSLLYMGFPIVYVPACAVLFDMPAARCGEVLLSVKFYVLALLAVAVGYGLWEMKRWAWYLFVLVNGLIAYMNAMMAFQFGESHHPLLAFLASIGWLVFLTYAVAREVRVPYFFPKIRWWESDPRYKISVPVTVTRPSGSRLPADILDLSQGGCFIKLRTELAQDEVVRLEFSIFTVALECEGIIVWRTRSTVTTPKGVGIKFSRLTRVQKRSLRVVTNRLKKLSLLHRRSRHRMDPEEYSRRRRELEAGVSQKEGLDPARSKAG